MSQMLHKKTDRFDKNAKSVQQCCSNEFTWTYETVNLFKLMLYYVLHITPK